MTNTFITYVVLFLIVIVLFILIGRSLGYTSIGAFNVFGGANTGPNQGNIVVDLLNATGYYYDEINHDNKIACIKKLTKLLKSEYTDRIMFVVKGKNTEHLTRDELGDFQDLAEKLRIYIYVTEQYELVDPTEHYEQARDDFYMCYLAKKYNCYLLTEDRLRDIAEFNKVPKFKIIEYAFWRAKPDIDFVNPAGIKLRKPKRLHYEDI